ncbi:hypothetical protein HFN71_28700 [Rhizobium laguerreae]|uniref:hypothetical protein n=1 Tax=Rhizobium laguerreae TaxID=1076926 RepID=UPI001C913613|nr:hypothetical protein [Rhizobium laguerreae]MBY3543665.1 hypothetical protein [Rhizobium laguerreae]
MASKDLHNNIYPKRGLSPVAAGTDNTAYVSQIVDTAGFEAVEWLTLIGANTDADATFTTLVEDGDASNLSDAAAVDDKFLLGTEALAGFAFDDDNEIRKIGYVGPKRYVRVTITPANNAAGNIFIAGVWVLGHPRSAPTANPPA